MTEITEQEIDSSIEDYTNALTNISEWYDYDLEIVKQTRDGLESDLNVLKLAKERKELEETKSFIQAQIFQKNLELGFDDRL